MAAGLARTLIGLFLELSVTYYLGPSHRFNFVKTDQVLTPQTEAGKVPKSGSWTNQDEGFIWSRSLFWPSTFLRGSVTLLSAEPQVLISDQCLPPLIVL